MAKILKVYSLWGKSDDAKTLDGQIELTDETTIEDVMKIAYWGDGYTKDDVKKLIAGQIESICFWHVGDYDEPIGGNIVIEEE